MATPGNRVGIFKSIANVDMSTWHRGCIVSTPRTAPPHFPLPFLRDSMCYFHLRPHHLDSLSAVTETRRLTWLEGHCLQQCVSAAAQRRASFGGAWLCLRHCPCWSCVLLQRGFAVFAWSRLDEVRGKFVPCGFSSLWSWAFSHLTLPGLHSEKLINWVNNLKIWKINSANNVIRSNWWWWMIMIVFCIFCC